ncbi:sulfotransferase domain-containing protein [Aurantiacibacter suaedae]|uniref:sulfotransferase domain-containing protein n=1 Tax=Aurantiacibacter suaedae TaxID=2545755 RepID=UPI0010F9DCA0|nr:sulfotransferase domain-containing protein [Aurantiacibacter suaedae]
MRVAIISSPRSGNTWFREVLSKTLGLENIAIHNYLDAPSSLPKKCALQIHWYREPNFQKFLLQNDFQLITLARHPLDVLISTLAFIRHEPETARWLGGNVAIPKTLHGCTPTSVAFANYAVSFGAENLLCVSQQWWHDENVIRVRYEDLVANPTSEFGRVVEGLGGGKQRLIEALDERDFSYFQSLPNKHGWKGRPGLWRLLIVPATARRIRRRHSNVFETLGYTVRPKLLLSRKRAEANWNALER